MLTLYSTPPAWGLTTFSPFCLKLETYLRMAEVPHEVAVGNPRKAPKQKVPYMEDGDNVLCDSSHIIAYLKERYGDPLDERLSDEERAHNIAVQRLIEDGLYFCILKLRWSSDAAWPHVQDSFRPLLPKFPFGFIMRTIRKQILKQTHAQGAGRHTDEELHARVQADLDVVAHILGARDYFGGDSPASLDATTYGFMMQIRKSPWDSAEKAQLAAVGNLNAYLDRMTERYFPGDAA